MKSKEEVYKKFYGRSITASGEMDRCMDEYAKDHAIAFKKWIDYNYCYVVSSEGDFYIHAKTKDIFDTIEELYSEFLKTIQ